MGELERALGQFEAGLNAPEPARPEPEWKAAVEALRAAMAKGPARADAHDILGLLLGRQGADGAEVAAEFRKAIELQPDFAAAHNHLGLVLIQSGKDEEGIAALREAVRLAPDYADARTNLGAALTPTDAEAAVRELERAVELAPGSVKAHFNLAAAYGASPRHGRAKEIETFRKVIELAPGFARARVSLGKALLQDGKVPEAIAELEEATRLEPGSGEAHYQLGLALARAGRKDEAAAALKKGRELVAAADRDRNIALDLAEGRAAMARGDVQQAVARFSRAVRLRPDSAEAQRELGAALEKQGDQNGASAAYRKALDANPADTTAREGLDRLARLSNAAAGVDDPARMREIEDLIRERKFAEAEPLAAAYVAARPRSSWGWYALGYVHFAQQEIGDSIKALAKSLELDLTNAEAHKILGRNLMIIGRFDAAQLEFELGLRYKPDSAELHYNLGKLFSIQDNWPEARKAFEAALRIDPDYVEAIDGLGFALEALGNDEEAVATYRRAAALNAERKGSFANPLVNLSAYFNRTDNPEQAFEHARQAVELDPKSDRGWFQRARAEERLGRLEDAVGALNRAIALNPRASSYYYVLAGIYRRLGWQDESRKALEQFKRLEQESRELDEKRRGIASGMATRPRPDGGA
ncbi:MAG TPA: tetratricopeptide repeat protein [Vicinamibacterales bacterium]